jgi:hypothetical protein
MDIDKLMTFLILYDMCGVNKNLSTKDVVDNPSLTKKKQKSVHVQLLNKIVNKKNDLKPQNSKTFKRKL